MPNFTSMYLLPVEWLSWGSYTPFWPEWSSDLTAAIGKSILHFCFCLKKFVWKEGRSEFILSFLLCQQLSPKSTGPRPVHGDVTAVIAKGWCWQNNMFCWSKHRFSLDRGFFFFSPQLPWPRKLTNHRWRNLLNVKCKTPYLNMMNTKHKSKYCVLNLEVIWSGTTAH